VKEAACDEDMFKIVRLKPYLFGDEETVRKYDLQNWDGRLGPVPSYLESFGWKTSIAH
jgi:hypothetical protein